MSEKTIIVHVYFSGKTEASDLDEFRLLVISAGASINQIVTTKREVPDAKFFIGSGKAEEIHNLIVETKASLVIFNHTLSPAQERNLEKLFECRVLDRSGLILDIFAQRARSFEGKLQVELAQLEHLATRLVRGWTHLERQKGGIGLRGPGETQLETDRRLLRQKVVYLKKRLEKVRSQRNQGRRSRKRSSIPTVAIVGYTNAGKSTLFNRLTRSDVYVANKLFATLDPTMRRVDLPVCGAVIFADTVGFLQNLPHELIESFRATLEETKEADLLLHVVDANDPLRAEKIEAVNTVLSEIGATEVPQILVYNKIDLLPEPEVRVDYDSANRPNRIWVSAINSTGIEIVRNVIQEFFQGDIEIIELCLLPNSGQLRARLHDANVVLSEELDVHGNLHLRLQIKHFDLLRLINTLC